MKKIYSLLLLLITLIIIIGCDQMNGINETELSDDFSLNDLIYDGFYEDEQYIVFLGDSTDETQSTSIYFFSETSKSLPDSGTYNIVSEATIEGGTATDWDVSISLYYDEDGHEYGLFGQSGNIIVDGTTVSLDSVVFDEYMDSIDNYLGEKIYSGDLNIEE